MVELRKDEDCSSSCRQLRQRPVTYQGLQSDLGLEFG